MVSTDNRVNLTAEQTRFCKILRFASFYQDKYIGTYQEGDNRISEFEVDAFSARSRLMGLSKKMKEEGYTPIDFLFGNISSELSSEFKPLLIYALTDGTFAVIGANINPPERR